MNHKPAQAKLQNCIPSPIANRKQKTDYTQEGEGRWEEDIWYLLLEKINEVYSEQQPGITHLHKTELDWKPMICIGALVTQKALHT